MGAVKREAAEDDEQHKIGQMVCQGWPAKVAEVPLEVRSYWNFRDTHTVEDGIIYKGDQAVVPTALHPDFLQRLHSSHQRRGLLARDGRPNQEPDSQLHNL